MLFDIAPSFHVDLYLTYGTVNRSIVCKNNTVCK